MNSQNDRSRANRRTRRMAFVFGGAVAGVVLDAGRGVPLAPPGVLVATAVTAMAGAMLGSWAFELNEKRTRGTLIGAIIGISLGSILLPLLDEGHAPSFVQLVINGVWGVLWGATIGTATRGAIRGAGVGAIGATIIMVVISLVQASNVLTALATGLMIGLVFGSLMGALFELANSSNVLKPKV